MAVVTVDKAVGSDEGGVGGEGERGADSNKGGGLRAGLAGMAMGGGTLVAAEERRRDVRVGMGWAGGGLYKSGREDAGGLLDLNRSKS